MRTFIFFILSLLATRGISVNNNTKIEIPFSLDRNLILIQVNIDAIGNRNFIFDTGTEGIMLMDSIANNYKVSGLDTIVTPTGEFVGTQEKVEIPKVQISNLTLEKLTAIKIPRQLLFSKNVIGIIGMQTFVGYMITFDYTNNKLILEKGDLKKESTVIPINLDHLLEANVKLNNKEVLAHFDCGAAGYISIPKSWSDRYKLKSEPVFLTKGKTPMGDFDVYRSDLDGTIEIGDYKISNPKINIVTGDFFYSINFGYLFFKDHLITVDTKNKLMQIKMLKDK